jgi:hypothetical protein
LISTVQSFHLAPQHALAQSRSLNIVRLVAAVITVDPRETTLVQATMALLWVVND